jgi:cyclophilin family peptidyl-prolyl cis-trans isomerase
MHTFLRLITLALAVFATSAWGQEQGANDPNAEFQAAVADYKNSLREINELEISYQSASATERQELSTKLKEVVAVGKAKLDRMVEAAIIAHKADPKKNPQVSGLLKEVAIHLAVGSEPPGATGGNYSGGDQPERALDIVNALVGSGMSETPLYVVGAVSAVYTNDFNTAKKYFELAQKGGAFEDLPQRPTSDMDPMTMYRVTAARYYQDLPHLEEQWEKEAKIRAAEAQADDLPRVKLVTSKGDVVIELFENEAPQATANFITLVKQGYYDGLPFHRVLNDFMAQGGDNGRGPGYTIRCECYKPDYRRHFRGSISMAKPAQPERDSGSAQFFLCFVPTRHLDGRHTAFGRVIEGMEVLGNLQKIDPSKPGPYPEPDKVLSASVLRDRGHDYEFEKIPSAN